jgi:hypothetical protein
MKYLYSRRLATALVTTTLLCTLNGCKSTNTKVSNAPPPTLASIAGEWEMDLSPQQDGSYIKSLIITPNISKADSDTFTGTTYGSAPYDNGLALRSTGSLTFSFVSDETGQMGGPYYWLGTASSSGTELSGKVQCLSRNLLMPWRASRKTQTPQS